MEMKWRKALASLGSLLFPHEADRIESTISSDRSLEERVEAAVESAQNELKLVDVFKHYILPPPQLHSVYDLDGFRAYNEFIRDIDKRVREKWISDMDMARQLEAGGPDLSQLTVWLPPEHNPFSLGKEGSTRVRRVRAEILDIALRDFPQFWEANRTDILSRLPAECLHQRVTDETDTAAKIESFELQRKFLVELAKSIAHFRGVDVDITGDTEPMVREEIYYRKPDGLITIGDRQASQELKTADGNSDKIAIARGQLVILGNSILRKKSRHQKLSTLHNELHGFVGTGIEVQVVRQVHAYMKMVEAFDGELLPLAQGPFRHKDYFEINTNMPAVFWIAAALDRMVMSGSSAMRAASEVVTDICYRDFGRPRLMASDGYGIGTEYIHVINSKAFFSETEVTVIGAARNNEMAVVLQVRWDTELWWLKMGPDVQVRNKALQDHEKLPIGGWERWFQVERDMLSRGMLQDVADGLPSAFAVRVQGCNRPAMLVKDAGNSVEKQLFTRHTTPEEVHEMSRQLYEALEAAGSKGVIHGDVCLENVCYLNGRYTLIDWGLACGRPFDALVAAVDKAWPGLEVRDCFPGIPNWEMSADISLCGMRPHHTVHDMESVLYCCMKILGGNVLPWSEDARSGSQWDVMHRRTETLRSLLEAHEQYIYEPLLVKLRQCEVLSPVSRPVSSLPKLQERMQV